MFSDLAERSTHVIRGHLKLTIFLTVDEWYCLMDPKQLPCEENDGFTLVIDMLVYFVLGRFVYREKQHVVDEVKHTIVLKHGLIAR
jgi:hypothetical protein